MLEPREIFDFTTFICRSNNIALKNDKYKIFKGLKILTCTDS